MSESYFSLKNVSSGLFLNGADYFGGEAHVTSGNSNEEIDLQWEIIPTDIEGFFAFRSAATLGYLDGRNPDCFEVLTSNRELIGDHYFYWQIISQ